VQCGRRHVPIGEDRAALVDHAEQRAGAQVACPFLVALARHPNTAALYGDVGDVGDAQPDELGAPDAGGDQRGSMATSRTPAGAASATRVLMESLPARTAASTSRALLRMCPGQGPASHLPAETDLTLSYEIIWKALTSRGGMS
jgi:hypothetical protein